MNMSGSACKKVNLTGRDTVTTSCTFVVLWRIGGRKYWEDLSTNASHVCTYMHMHLSNLFSFNYELWCLFLLFHPSLYSYPFILYTYTLLTLHWPNTWYWKVLSRNLTHSVLHHHTKKKPIQYENNGLNGTLIYPNIVGNKKKIREKGW